MQNTHKKTHIELKILLKLEEKNDKENKQIKHINV